ncbi:MAG: fibronectin type III domain-containing protein [Patescibacteria group bacterium]
MPPPNTKPKSTGLLNRIAAKLQTRKPLPLVLFALGFAIVGVVMLFQSFAAGTSTISGVLFDDANRNGMQDSGEVGIAGKYFWIHKATGATAGGVTTDSTGRYSLSGIEDGGYKIFMAGNDWDVLRNDWVPSNNGGSLQPEWTVQLAGTATADLGIRKIVRSADVNNPITSVTGPDGMKVSSFNDAIPAQQIYDEIHTGTLRGAEAAVTTINFDLNVNVGGVCQSSWNGVEGAYNGYHASISVAYGNWLVGGNSGLFHEYGHAWSLYHQIMIQQTEIMTSYLEARGLADDPRIGTSVLWDPKEMIAEDYRKLFGTGTAASQPISNILNMPNPEDVPGLREYLSGAFMTTRSTNVPPAQPTNLTATASSSPEGPAVQLNWTASSGGNVDRYDIYRSDNLDTFNKIGYVNSPSTTYYDGANLQFGKKYVYYVKAVSPTGQVSNDSSHISVTTLAPDTTKPSAPSGLMSTGTTTTSISLQWLAATDNVGVKEYRIYQDGTRKTLTSLKGTATGTNFTVTGLKSNTSHTFYVTAVDTAGNESLPSKTLSVKTRR